MSNGTSTNVEIGPGLLYVAPLATAEPTTATAAIPSAWRAVGYTDQGSQFSFNLANSPVDVAEELDPIEYATTGRDHSVDFAMAESTRQNLAMALNAGAAGANDATTFEPPDPGTEVRVMLLHKTDQGALWLFRKCLQAGNVQMAKRKAPAKSLIAVTFRLEKPTGAAPWKVFPTAAGLV